MRNTILFFSLSFLLSFFVSCTPIETYENSPTGNFEALWKIMDEHYCFFEEKQVDWDSIHKVYKEKIPLITNQFQLFNTLDSMLQELRDGHVNLYSAFNVGRYWKWFQDYEANYNQEIINTTYLQRDYQIAGGIQYKLLPLNTNDYVGYIRYSSFSSPISQSNLAYIFMYFNTPPIAVRSIIIDVRNNGGGALNLSDLLASCFFKEKTTVGYMRYKTGKGHNAFSKYYPKYIEPTKNQTIRQYSPPVFVLTNRSCYSACNNFVNTMRYAPFSIIIGDKTGGGGGLPFSSQLPIGWSVRYSAAPFFDNDKKSIEEGIEPNISIASIREDLKQQPRLISSMQDSLIEYAIYLSENPQFIDAHLVAIGKQKCFSHE